MSQPLSYSRNNAECNVFHFFNFLLFSFWFVHSNAFYFFTCLKRPEQQQQRRVNIAHLTEQSLISAFCCFFCSLPLSLCVFLILSWFFCARTQLWRFNLLLLLLLYMTYMCTCSVCILVTHTCVYLYSFRLILSYIPHIYIYLKMCCLFGCFFYDRSSSFSLCRLVYCSPTPTRMSAMRLFHWE